MERAADRLGAGKIAHRRDGSYIHFPAAGGLDYWFLGPRNASPTDRPEHFVHPNGAEALVGVWLAADDLSRERRLLEAVGARVQREDVHVPVAAAADVAHLQEGDVVFLPGRRQLVPGRRIVGATISVKSLDVVRRLLAESPARAARQGSSVFVEPAIAHGIWLEFRERG
jgi:hypothetical protein